jgi:phosphoenolpyruvate-protein kinase (PTS system EI component)
LRRAGVAFQEVVELGVIVETPAAVLGARDLAREADFLCIGLDSLQQYLLAADRENHALASTFETLHPYVLRALVSIVEAAEQAGRPLQVFGVTCTEAVNVPFLLGVGLKQFVVPAGALQEFVAQVGCLDARAARRTAALALRASSRAETQTFVDGYRHGFVR